MKISELIKKLQDTLARCGDVELFFIERIYCDTYDEVPVYDIKLIPKVGEYKFWEDDSVPLDFNIKEMWIELE